MYIIKDKQSINRKEWDEKNILKAKFNLFHLLMVPQTWNHRDLYWCSGQFVFKCFGN